MATPQEIRRIRLKNDYDQMCNIKGNAISWMATKGTEPYVEEYKIALHIRSIGTPASLRWRCPPITP